MKSETRQKLAALSRDRSAIIKGASIIGGISFVIALIVSITTSGLGKPGFFPLTDDPKQWEDFLEKMAEEVEEELGGIESKQTFEGFAMEIRFLDLEEESLEGVRERLGETETISDPEKALLSHLMDGLYGKEAEKSAAQTALKADAEKDSPVRFANEFLGDIQLRAKNYDEAIQFYRTEVDSFSDAEFSQYRALSLLYQEEKFETLLSIYKTEKYENPGTLDQRIKIAAKLKDLPYLFNLSVEFSFTGIRWWTVALALFSASIWFVIIAQFCGFEKRHLAHYFASILLGIFSIVITLFLIFIQERIYDFRLENAQNPIQHAIYMIAGVGLREEFCKLLCFVPIAFLLRKRQDYTLAFVCAGMVGLGFALWENLNYYLSFGALTSWGRFLTANFFHIGLTSLVGISLFRVICRKGRGWENFLLDFLMIVCLHGIYNASISIGELGEFGGLLNIILYALFAYRYFDVAERYMQTNRSQAYSPLGIFCIGAALLISVVFIAVAYGSPFTSALSSYLFSLSSMVVIAFIFINRFRNA